MKLLASHGLTTPLSMLSNEWRKPFNISIGLHVIVMAVAMLAPSLFDRQPRLPEIYTVNLFTATEVAEPEVQTAAKPAARKLEPATKKPAVSIQASEPEVAPAVTTPIAKPVSLQPLKEKVKLGKTKEEEAGRYPQDKSRHNNRDLCKNRRPIHFYYTISGNHRPQGNRHRT
jgi:hypothetical protein